MKNHRKRLLLLILFSTLLLPLGVQAQDGEIDVTETETVGLVTTTEESEASNEGIAWNGSGTGKVYRFYNSKTSQHLYTSNEAEKKRSAGFWLEI